MKLILAIISNDDSTALIRGLNKESYQVTKLATTGGFLRAGNITLLIGCEAEKVQRAIEIIEKYSSQREELVPNTAGYDMGAFSTYPVKVTVGGATVFVLDVEQFLKL